jgi:hypothetical protein
MGSQEHPGDVEHRYELRRSLLGSRFFEHRASRWERMMGYTAPLFAGGMMVGVFALMAAQVSIEPEIGPQTVSSRISVVQESSTSAEVTPIRVEDFLSSPDEPTVALAGFESAQEARVHYVPLANHQYVRTQ